MNKLDFDLFKDISNESSSNSLGDSLNKLVSAKLTKKKSLEYINSLVEENWIKTREDLITDLNNNEIIIVLYKGSPIMLNIIGACQIQRNDGKWLLEYKQEFKSGKVTNRNIPISGKLKISEDIVTEMSREV